MNADPRCLVDALVADWDAIAARLHRAGLTTRAELVTCEIWAHGGVITIAHPHDPEDDATYALSPDGKLMHYHPHDGWRPVDEEAHTP